MKKITITLDEETAAWARVHAAQHNVSLSRFVSELLQQRMHEPRDYNEAMRRFLSKAPVKLKRAGESYAMRDELHEHDRLR